MERSHSGLVRWSRKPLAPQGARGFESLPLRQETWHCGEVTVTGFWVVGVPEGRPSPN